MEKKILQHAPTWMNLGVFILSEISQSQKDKHCMIPLVGDVQSGEIYRERKQSGCQGLGEREMESYCLMGKVSVLQEERVPEMDGGDGCTTR